MCEIYVHALTCLLCPWNFKVFGYIRKQRVIVFIDLGSAYNFIVKGFIEDLNCFLYPVTNFQVLVANGGVLIAWENTTTSK